MALIDNLSYKESLFRTIFCYCNIERHEDGLYLKPLNPKMKDTFSELGFTTPTNCYAFCQAWEENARSIGKNWFKGCHGINVEEYYEAFEKRYYNEMLGEGPYNE